MFSKKRGSVDWTIGKLLAIVLLIVVIVIVIWGLTTGGLTPLIERTGGKFDEVLILLSRLGGKQPSGAECVFQNVNIDGVGVGDSALCKTYCNISLNEELTHFNSKDFKFEDNKIFLLTEIKSWIDENDYLIDIDKVSLDRQVYFELKKSILLKIFGEESVDYNHLNLVLGFDEERVLEFRVLSGDEPIFRWNGEKWDVSYPRYTASQEREVGIKEIYGYYTDNYKVAWGYRGDDINLYKIPFTNTIGDSKDKSHIDEERFSIWLNKKIDEWNLNYSLHKEGLEKLKGETNDIIIDGKSYSVSFGKSYFSGIHNVPFIYITILEDRKGTYYLDKKFYFYSEKDENIMKEDYYNYNFIRTSPESIWEDIKKLNLIYDYLKERC
jgi:hypothetical protein